MRLLITSYLLLSAYLLTLTSVIAGVPPLLQLDIDQRAGTNALTQAGFSSFLITNEVSDIDVQSNATVRSFGPYTVTLSGVDGGDYNDRERTTPVDLDAFTDSLLLRDFVFAATQGLDLTLEGLNTGAVYQVTLWSFDTASGGNRVSDWTSNGVLVRDNYAFNGGTLPVSNADYAFSFNTQADTQGVVRIEGRADASTSVNPSVFINAIRVEESTFTPPVFTEHPLDAEVYAGERVSLGASISGPQPIVLQWLQDGRPLAGETMLGWATTNALVSDSGVYQLVASNAAGAVTSEVATLTVIPTERQTALLGYWPLDEARPDGLSTPDIVGTNHLELVNVVGTNFVAGKVLGAVSLNGVDEILVANIDPAGPLSIGNQRSYSVMLWAMGVGTNQNDRRVFSQGSSTDGDPLFNLGTHSTGASASLDLYVRNNTGTTMPNHTRSVSPAFDGTWHHVALVYEPGDTRVYIDGVLDGRNFISDNASMTLDRLSVGGIMRAAASHHFKGLVDEVAFYGRAITGDEVRESMDPSLWPPEISRVEAQGDIFRFLVPFGRFGNRTYVVEQKDHLLDAGWNPIAVSNIGPTQNHLFIEVRPGGTRGYLRLGFLP